MSTHIKVVTIAEQGPPGPAGPAHTGDVIVASVWSDITGDINENVDLQQLLQAKAQENEEFSIAMALVLG